MGLLEKKSVEPSEKPRRATEGPHLCSFIHKNQHTFEVRAGPSVARPKGRTSPTAPQNKSGVPRDLFFPLNPWGTPWVLLNKLNKICYLIAKSLLPYFLLL